MPSSGWSSVETLAWHQEAGAVLATVPELALPRAACAERGRDGFRDVRRILLVGRIEDGDVPTRQLARRVAEHALEVRVREHDRRVARTHEHDADAHVAEDVGAERAHLFPMPRAGAIAVA